MMLNWRTRSILSVAMLACAAGARAGEAASPSPAPDPMALRLALSTRVGRGALVRVEGAWGAAVLTAPRLTGSGLEYSEAQVGPLAQREIESPPNPIPITEISRLQIRVGSSRRCAIIGGIAGGLLGAAVVSVIVSAEGGGDAGGMLGFALLNGSYGAGGGALIGMLVRRWQTVYKR